MNPTFELVATVQQDREREVRADRLARLVAQARACCSPSTITRLARALRATPAACC